MKIKKITYPTALEAVDIDNDNIDVFIETEDGRNYTVTVCTPKFYLSYMEREKTSFIPPGCPDVVVSQLTNDIIKEALETYCEYDGYWLKLFHLAGTDRDIFSVRSMDQMLDDDIEIENRWEAENE